jgi:hypothetical protein
VLGLDAHDGNGDGNGNGDGDDDDDGDQFIAANSRAVGRDGRWAAMALSAAARRRGLQGCPRKEIVDAVHRSDVQ